MAHNDLCGFLTEIFASSAAYIYDYLLCLPLEITLIWPAPNSVVKIVHILIRYLNLISIILAIPTDLFGVPLAVSASVSHVCHSNLDIIYRGSMKSKFIMQEEISDWIHAAAMQSQLY